MNAQLLNLILQITGLIGTLAPQIFSEVEKINALRELSDDLQANILKLAGSAHDDNMSVQEAVEAWRKENGL